MPVASRAPTVVSYPIRTLWLAWVAFVIYGSLVPLDYRPLAWDAAWARLADAPMIDVGSVGRADWIANGVLYLPVGFLTTVWWLGGSPRSIRRAIGAVLGSLSFGCALAIAVEFAQVFFPPRTVSRNDLLAEALGTALGTVAALYGSQPFKRLITSLGAGGALLRRLTAPAYLIVYVGLALFPFDVLLDAQEWTGKLQSGQVAWLLASADAQQGLVRLVAKLLVETAAAAPLGAWWASRRFELVAAGRAKLSRAWTMGLLLGLATELAQLCIISGISQGASVLTRAVGFVVGAALLQRWTNVHVETLRAAVRRATAPLLLLYLPVLTVQFGWWRGAWMDIHAAMQRLQHEIHFVPLYYHYFTSEATALVSVLAVLSSYAPVGLLGFAWHLAPLTSAACATVLAVLIELGRLMVASTKPDPSNVLIAACGAWLAHQLTQHLAGPAARRGRAHR